MAHQARCKNEGTKKTTQSPSATANLVSLFDSCRHLAPAALRKKMPRKYSPGLKSGDCVRSFHGMRVSNTAFLMIFTYSNAPGTVGMKVDPSPMRGADAARKRSFRRAIHKATNSDQQVTWYTGRSLTRRQLGKRASEPFLNNCRSSSRSPQTCAASPRLRIITWKCGGLHDTKYREIAQGLCDEYSQGRPVHILVFRKQPGNMTWSTPLLPSL